MKTLARAAALACAFSTAAWAVPVSSRGELYDVHVTTLSFEGLANGLDLTANPPFAPAVTFDA
jgi:hypothetical protein